MPYQNPALSAHERAVDLCGRLMTSKAVDAEKYQALLANETRYSRLTRAFPERAKQLFARNEQVANDRYEHLTRLVELYK